MRQVDTTLLNKLHLLRTTQINIQQAKVTVSLITDSSRIEFADLTFSGPGGDIAKTRIAIKNIIEINEKFASKNKVLKSA